jgi:hypothetical protein
LFLKIDEVEPNFLPEISISEFSHSQDPKRRFATVNYRTAKGSLDHFVGDGEQCRRHVEAQRFGSLEVNDQLELSRLHDWQVGRLFALENTSGIDADCRYVSASRVP